MIETLQTADVLRELKQLQGERSLRSFATALGISAAYLSDIYGGKRSIGPSVLKPLRLTRRSERTVVYVRTIKQPKGGR